METRDLWIDQPYAESTWRVRELDGGEVRTLAVFPTREQAQLHIQHLLNPEPASQPEPETPHPSGDADETPRPKATWTRGVSP